MLYFQTLGLLEIRGGGRARAPATPKVTSLLALLLCRANQIVSTAEIMEELWGEHPPRSASATTQTYVYQLRKLLHDLDPDGARGGGPLETRPPGYRLRVDDEQLDIRSFEHLAATGFRLIDDGELDEAIATLRGAAKTWHGPAFANVEPGQIVQAHIARLDEMLLRVREQHIQGFFMQGRFRETISELSLMAKTYRLNEWVHGRLIQALFWTGRRADALAVYRGLRRNLAEELGIDPSPDLQDLELAVLNASLPATPAHGLQLAVPGQTPPDLFAPSASPVRSP